MDEFKQLQKAQKAADSGKREQAKNLLDALILYNPANYSAWIALSKLVDCPEDEADCLRRALSVNPDPNANLDITTKMRLAEIEGQINQRSWGVQPPARDKIWELLERGTLESIVPDDPEIYEGWHRSRSHSSDLATSLFANLISAFQDSNTATRIDLGLGTVLVLAALVFIYNLFAKSVGSGTVLLSFFLPGLGFMACCGMWIWRIVIAKVSIPAAEKRLVVFAALNLVGIAAYFVFLAGR